MKVFCAYNQDYDKFLNAVVEYIMEKYGDNLDLQNVQVIELIRKIEDSTTDRKRSAVISSWLYFDT